jgi:hypothetical protein
VASKKNKHGLPRHIPSHVKYQIRQNDGYGCVICGSLLVEYEHISPEFSEATEHNPANMALLCPSHHAQVTKGLLSKRTIEKHKANPHCKSHGYTSIPSYPNFDAIKILVGSNEFLNTTSILEMNGKPLIWLEIEDNSPILLNAIFYNENNEKIAFINKNEFIGLVNRNQDITCIGSRVEVRLENNRTSLTINLHADNPVKIEKLRMHYQKCAAILHTDESLEIKSINCSSYFKEMRVNFCEKALVVERIPYTLFEDILFKEKVLKVKRLTNDIKKESYTPIINLQSKVVGYISGKDLINLQGYRVAYIFNNLVYNLYREYIGELINLNANAYQVIMRKDHYDDGEPIYVNRYNRTLNRLGYPFIDLSFRLFE